MQFLQSLNSLIDNLEQLHGSTMKRSMCDVTSPLLSTYKFTFHIKLDPISSEGGDDTDSIPQTRAINLTVSVPQDLTFRQTASSSIIKKRISALLHRIGPVFEAVGMESPWTLEDGDVDEEKLMPWERTSRRTRSQSTSSQGFRKRRPGVSLDDPSIQAAIEEKMVEKSMAGMFSPSIFGGSESTRLIKGDVDKYIRNGNILTTNLSPIDQLHTMKRVRDFFLKCGHLVNFSFDVWNSVLILIDGSRSKNTFAKESLKKRLLITIPPKFQSVQMIQYLHQAVPQARVVLPSMDGMKEDDESSGV
jgi:hypothetical protein